MRVRLTFSKMGPMQYVGHLDLHRSWERVFRRSGLPLQYSQGFHPQPRLHLACALPVGITSDCELLDAWLEMEFPLQQVQEAVHKALPPGLQLSQLQQIDDRAPALQTLVSSAVYVITFLDEVSDLAERLQRLGEAEHLFRTRHHKSYDLRPLIESLDLDPPLPGQQSQLRVKMATREGATGRPEELLDELGIPFANTHVHREMLILTAN